MNTLHDYFKRQENTLDARYRDSYIEGHMPDTGTNRETILRDWLSNHLPRVVTPELGGKIIDSHETVSGQVDIAIYDNALPHFGANPKSYFFAEGVTSALQVKSILKSKELQESVKNLATVKKCKKEFGGGIIMGDISPEIFTGIFAFETEYKSSEAIINALNDQLKDYPPIDFLCVNKKVYIAYNHGGWIGYKEDGSEEKLPIGYIVLDNREGCIWRMIISMTQEAKKVVVASVDFQKYFLSAYKDSPEKDKK